MSRHATNPPWKDSLADSDIAPLSHDITCDVCILGAGIAGLSVAYEIAQLGRQVVIIDPNSTPGGGETRATTAHLASVIDDRFVEVAHIRGAEAARLAHQSHAAAIDRIESIYQAEKINCGFRRLDGYLFPGHGDEKLIHDELQAAREAGCDVELQHECPIPSLCDGPCLRFAKQATFEPSRYMAGLWAAAARRGAKFHGKTRAVEVKGGSPVTVKTDRGGMIHAESVVVATNTPIHTRVTTHTKLAPYTTYAIASPIARGSVPDGLYWDTLDPYHYIRVSTALENSKQGRDTDLLIVGGADHKTGQESDPVRRWDDLEQWARARFPQFREAMYYWSGMVMETLDGLAYIGADPSGDKNVFVSAGDSGMGLTHGTIAGLLLRDLILGRSNNPWVELYDPSRMPFRSTSDFVAENANVAAQYRDWLTSGDVGSEEAVKRGSGAIVRRGLSKLAIYRDDAGKIHRMSAVCPHLSGLVRWNEAEQTWDCPCHGSRFRATGEVMHGPANTGLGSAEN